MENGKRKSAVLIEDARRVGKSTIAKKFAHEKKVPLSLIQEGATFKWFAGPFFWLEDSLICADCYKCNEPSVGLSLNEGMIYENAIAQMIASTGRKLYFYNHFSAECKRNDIEIDFLISSESKTSAKVYPIEVRSSKNYTCCSFARFKGKIASGYIVHPKGYSSSDGVYKVPPYMFFFLLKEGLGQ